MNTNQDDLPKRALILCLVVIVCLGAWLRFHNLSGACLWIDEITFVNESNLASPLAIWNRMVDTYSWQHQPALPRMIEWCWLRIVRLLGVTANEAIYRVPAAMAGVASLLVMYLLGKRLFGGRVGIVAAFLLSVSFFHVWYSREAYNYSPYLLCMLLSWYWLARLYQELADRGSASWKSLVWYAVTTAFALQMVLAGVVLVLCEFFLLVLAAWSSPLRSLSNEEKSRRIRPVLVALVLACVPFAPFLWKLAHYVSADTYARQHVGLLAFVKMIGEMGWGSQPVPLAIFLVCVVAGVVLAWREPRTRDAVVMCLVLGGFSAVCVGYIERLGRYETRYFLSLLPPLLLLVAVAWVRLADALLGRFSSGARWSSALVVAAALLGWQVPFYSQLYQLKGKGSLGRDLANWINEHVPTGGIYVLDNSFVRREVPDFYSTPGRYCTSPAPHEPNEDMTARAQLIRNMFRRFPDCTFVDSHSLFDPTRKEDAGFLAKTFRQHVRIDDPAVPRLYRMGIFPSGAFNREEETPRVITPNTEIYFNTTDDLIELNRSRGWFVLFGAEWKHAEIPLPQGGWDHWKGLAGEGKVRVFGVIDKPERMNVRMRCASYEISQGIRVEIAGKETQYQLAPGNVRWIELGPMNVQPGENEFIVSKESPQRDGDRPNFMVYEVSLSRTGQPTTSP